MGLDYCAAGRIGDIARSSAAIDALSSSEIREILPVRDTAAMPSKVDESKDNLATNESESHILGATKRSVFSHQALVMRFL